MKYLFMLTHPIITHKPHNNEKYVTLTLNYFNIKLLSFVFVKYITYEMTYMKNT